MTEMEKSKVERSRRSMIISFPGIAGLFKSEEPLYYVLEKKGNKEIRDYKSYLMAFTEIHSTSHSEALTLGFWKLYDYFRNHNFGERALDGGPPVSSKVAKMNLTIPVFESRAGSTWKISMMIPSRYMMNTVPLPEDHSIQVVEVPECIVAVIRVKGFTNAQTIENAKSELERWIISRGKFRISASPHVAHYDLFPAFEFLRRTEIQVPLQSVEMSRRSQ